jgi:hypothetical protein
MVAEAREPGLGVMAAEPPGLLHGAVCLYPEAGSVPRRPAGAVLTLT